MKKNAAPNREGHLLNHPAHAGWRRAAPLGLAALVALSVLSARADAVVCSSQFTSPAGTVKDEETGLSWKKLTGQQDTWDNARKACQNAGRRLPSVFEMQTVVREDTGTLVGGLGGSGVYWTATRSTPGNPLRRFFVGGAGAVNDDKQGTATTFSPKHLYVCVK